MIVSNELTLIATVCNTTPDAVPYALWLARGSEQYLVDLSDVLGQPGDGGLTGIACSGGRIYAAVQSSGAPRILVLDRRLTPVAVFASPDFVDIHSIHVSGDTLLVCSTGNQSVIRFDLTEHSMTKLCQFEAVVHLNSACLDGAELLVCCHYPGRVVPEAVGGGVIAVGEPRVILAGLGQPHSLLSRGDDFLVLDSDGRRVIRFDYGGIRQQQSISGFPRGIAVAGGSVFVASSAGRVVSRKSPLSAPARLSWTVLAERVCIHELDAGTLAVKGGHFPLIAGFEIYDLIALEPSWEFEPPRERLIAPDPGVLSRIYYEDVKRALAAQGQHR